MGALAGALFLWFLDAAMGWGSPAGAWGAGAFAGLGVAAWLRLNPLNRSLAQGNNKVRELTVRDSERIVLKLREERLDITKEKVPLQDVQVRREWVEEIRSVEVPLYREELVVEKNGEEACRIPVREERLELRKFPVELNRVDIRNEQWEEKATVEAMLRKEVARVTVSGEADVMETGNRPE